jgi:hypothetical protein
MEMLFMPKETAAIIGFAGLIIGAIQLWKGGQSENN